jgi:hypothetical protein
VIQTRPENTQRDVREKNLWGGGEIFWRIITLFHIFIKTLQWNLEKSNFFSAIRQRRLIPTFNVLVELWGSKNEFDMYI